MGKFIQNISGKWKTEADGEVEEADGPLAYTYANGKAWCLASVTCHVAWAILMRPWNRWSHQMNETRKNIGMEWKG